MKTTRILLLAGLVTMTNASALSTGVPDTPGNRLAAAQQYVQAMRLKDMWRDLVQETSKNMESGKRREYVEFMTEEVNIATLEQAALISMTKHFTVDELNALTAFYKSPEGQSAMKKYGQYMADVLPSIQQEMTRAMQAYKNKNK